MPPKGEAGSSDAGLLEYLEDIIGTDKYVPQIEAASKGYVFSISFFVFCCVMRRRTSRRSLARTLQRLLRRCCRQA